MENENSSGSGLIFQHIYKSFPGVGLVLSDFNITLNPGSFVSLVGPTGCGKSTLLRLILGLEQTDKGKIQFVNGKADQPGRLAIAFQEPRLLPWLTVRQNIELVLQKTGQTKRVDDLLELVELSDFADSYPKVLSGGMSQRVSLARALANEPEVLLLDEPFSAVDAITRMRLQDALMRIYLTRPRTTLMVTHDIDEALLTSQQVIVLSSRPARIVDIVEVNAEYPRERTDNNLFSLKARILKDLGVEAAHNLK